jgi:hypothetical protein
MARRSTRSRDHLREPDHVQWDEFPAAYWKALALTFAIGLLCGLIWIVWRLLDIHVLR